MHTLRSILFFLSLAAPLFAQVTGTTAQPLARDATTFNINRARLDFSSGQTLKLESGATFSIDDGTTFTIGPTAATAMTSALNIGVGTRAFANTAARTAATPTVTGQFGVQYDDGTIWRATSATAGAWSGAFGVVSVGAAAGSAASPSIYWTADTTTGFYRPSAHALSFAANTAEILRLDANQLRTTVGTEALPGYAFLGAAGTGFRYDAGTTSIFITNAGADVVQIDGSGGITTTGTITGSVLAGEIQNFATGTPGVAALPVIHQAGDNNTGIYFPNPEQVAISTNGVERFLVTDTATTITTLALTNALPIASGGTGAVSASAARTALLAQGREIVIYSHMGTEGTNGGSSTAGSWQQRTINREDVDSHGLATYTGNIITLQPGTWRCSAHFQFGATGHTQLRLYDNTNGAELLRGVNQVLTATAGTALLEGRFTIAAATGVVVQYWCTTAVVTTGLGTPTSFVAGDEFFGFVTFERE